MKDRVNSAQLEALIRAKVREKGLSNDIDESKIIEIKEKIKSQLKQPQALIPSMNVNEQVPAIPNEQTAPVTTPIQTITSTPEAIAQTVTISKDAVELAKKEGEIEQKEKDISDREATLANKEAELQRKQDELAYKPQIPAILENIGNENLFIFDENEISLGAEALSNAKLRLMSNPDDKKSMMELWATEGKKAADLYLVKFEKIGEITFNPFEGTSKYENKPFDDGQTPNDIPADGLTPEEAQASQEPIEPIVDTIEPKVDVTLAPSQDMGLNSTEIDNMIKTRIEDYIKSHFSDKFPKM